ncbi:MAG TPA: DegV family protein, partial [Candidatus Limiplasma sp.]|nr:DegV family protein [Candidatus Limiplasma sp.]
YSDGTARGSHEQLKKLVESVPQGVAYVVIHCHIDNPMLTRLQAMLRARLGDRLELRMVSLGPVLTIHLGLSYLGVCWMD